MKRWTETDPRSRLLIDSIGLTEWTCGGCAQPVRNGYACRCSVPCVALAGVGDAGGAYRAEQRMLQAGSDQVSSSPLVKCYPLPVARAQPRNEVPRWARRFFRALEQRLDVPDGMRGVPAIMAWGCALVVVGLALFAVWAWNGAGPQIVAPERKRLTALARYCPEGDPTCDYCSRVIVRKQLPGGQ